MFNRPNQTFPEREEKVLAFWKKQKIFQQSVEQRKGAPLFSIYDGPPFATGLPHYGHFLAGTIKDVIPRYQTMRGRYAPRRFGWDCHGLPVENEIEKAKELSGAPAIEKFGIAAFNEECRKIVLRYTSEWEKRVERMGRWIDFTKTYRTMDLSFMESVWWVFKELWEKGLIYQGFKVMPFSAQLGTPLSNFEANLNYKEVDDPSVVVMFPLEKDRNTSLLIWTTTPWTLPSNQAAIVNKNLSYAKVWDEKRGKHFILAKTRVETYFGSEAKIIATISGEQLQGKRYIPPFHYIPRDANSRQFTILTDNFVGEEEGTGIVHAAPAFGELDFFACLEAGIDLVCPVDQNGKFTNEIPEYEGRFVKDADKEIIRSLKEKALLFEAKQIRHRYPFCWRSDTPLIYKAVRTWFVAVEKIKDQLIETNQHIRWIPEHLKEGRFGKWLENAKDWAISRNRYFGTPIPIWKSDEDDCIAIGSIAELESYTQTKVTDLHRHHIDPLTFTHRGKKYKRISEVFDCWFESGSVPYAQNHYPFASHKSSLAGFPADFIAEGLDQTRGWFYTLHVLSTALFHRPAFQNVIVNGIILAEDGAKMSKRLKNYPEPMDVVNRYGADAVRLYLLNSPGTSGEDLRFQSSGVELTLRQVLLPFWNAYSFLSTYASIYHWSPHASKKELSSPLIDRWILSKLHQLIDQVTHAMEHYLLQRAIFPIIAFIEQLTNWYIRRSRSRFWTEEDSEDRESAFTTLYETLLTLTKISAPFIPFLSESIYREIRLEKDPISVHLCDFPSYDKEKRDFSLEEEMETAQQIVSMGHALRKQHKLKVRQPLLKAILLSPNPKTLKQLTKQKELILAELNVKEIEFRTNEADFVTLQIKPHFRILGKKVGSLMNRVQEKISQLKQEERTKLLQGESLPIELEQQTLILTPEDVIVERVVKKGLVAKTDKEITIALDTTLNDSLIDEGIAREFVNKINTQRRDEGFSVTDRVNITLATTKALEKKVTAYRNYIAGEVLAVRIDFSPTQGTEWEINGEKVVIHLSLQNAF